MPSRPTVYRVQTTLYAASTFFWKFYACSDLPCTRAVMFTVAAEHPVLVALAVLIAGWVVRFVRKGYAVRKTFHDQVCCVKVVVVLPADD